MSTNNSSCNHHNDDNNHHNNIVTMTAEEEGDVEEGIEIPLPLEEGVELPLDVFQQKIDNIKDNDDNDLVVKSKKKLPSSPTKTISTSSSSLSSDDDNNDAFAHKKWWWTSSSSDHNRLIILAAIIFIIIIVSAGVLTSLHLTSRTPYEEKKNEEEVEEDSNSDGGDKQPPETTIETPTSTTTTFDNTNEQQPPTLPQRPPPIDKFLLSGQSNMVGHTTSGQSITSNAKYWKRLKSILQQQGVGGGNLDTMKNKLYNAIYNANYYEYSNDNDQVARTLTNGIMELYNSSLLNDLDIPLQFGKCSFLEVVDDTNVYDVSQGTVPTVWNANCGYSFGHELLFSRTLELTMNYNTTQFEMHKIARGGSGLYEHWYPNHGLHWNLLKDAIEQRQDEGDWKGFIWHQGSQETWSEQQYGEDRSLTYHGNLTGLVNEMRELMYQNSNSWQCKEEIPVVVVQVGFWPGNNALASRTRDAQARLCNEDPRAVLVKTDDLARFYHYDAASFLIMGNRIAHAYQEALQGDVDCPDRVPSSSPTLESMNPSKSVEPTVLMSVETDWPSSNNTSELV